MAAFRPLDEEEALALTRHQFMERVEETQKYWARKTRRGLTDEEVAAERAFSGLIFKYLKPGDAISAALRLVRDGDRGAGGGRYWEQRLDGSPAHPPRRVQLRRVSGWKLPYGCKPVSRRSSAYGNPFTKREYGDRAVSEFTAFLRERREDPRRWPGIEYPSDGLIVAELGGWDLACWCPVPDGWYLSPAGVAAAMLGHVDRCHADVLLRVSNGGRP